MIQFTKPVYLLLLIPMGYYFWRLSRHSLSDLSRLRSGFAFGIRCAIILAIILALSGTRMVRNVTNQCVVFALDVSDSIQKNRQDEALAYINNALNGMKSNQKAAIVAFGTEASIELAPSEVKKIEKIYSVPGKNQTDISQALGLALALFPENSAKKIVLLSDGNETRGKALEQALLAGSEDVSVDIVPISNDLQNEVLLDKIICPNSVKVGEPFEIKVIGVSKQQTSARLRIIRNGETVKSQAVDLTKGKSVFVYRQSIAKDGNYEFQAIIDSKDDTCLENNIALGHTMVEGKPKVLYIEGSKGQEKYLVNALRSSDIDVEARSLTGIPASLTQLRGYDMIILSDVPAWSMVPEQMTIIETGVKDLGIGLTMIGGENSFGAGGYFDTPVERALPLDMSLKKTKILPSSSVVIVMDKSGSMGAPEGGKTKIELANDAAAAVVKLLQKIDNVGVIVCHTQPVAAVPIKPARDKDVIYKEISTIRAEGGGISVYPSMKMANDMISTSNTRIKHVILLADGADCDMQAGVIPLVKDMADRKITVTAVAFGEGKDVPFLKSVAAVGKGGYYLARRGADLKAIFTKDVMSVSKSLIIEEPFVPVIDTSSPELSGIDQAAVPPLLGYVAASPKPTAGVSMLSHKKDPVLASWQYGLGRSAAFTSDCKARWSARWLDWSGYSKFWAQVLRWAMRKTVSTDFQNVLNVEGGVGNVTLDAVDNEGNFLNQLQFQGTIIDPDMHTYPLAIEQTGPGRYEATFDAGEPGTYLVNVIRKDQKDAAPDMNVLSISYPVEYKDFDPNTALLRQIASETSGVFAPHAEDIFIRDFRHTRTYVYLWQWLILAVTIMLPLDIAIRRLMITPHQVREIAAKGLGNARRLQSTGNRQHEKVESIEVVGDLLQSRRKRRSSDNEQANTITKIKTPSETSSTPPQAEPSDLGKHQESTDTVSRLLDAKRRVEKKRK